MVPLRWTKWLPELNLESLNDLLDQLPHFKIISQVHLMPLYQSFKNGYTPMNKLAARPKNRKKNKTKKKKKKKKKKKNFSLRLLLDQWPKHFDKLCNSLSSGERSRAFMTLVFLLRVHYVYLRTHYYL